MIETIFVLVVSSLIVYSILGMITRMVRNRKIKRTQDDLWDFIIEDAARRHGCTPERFTTLLEEEASKLRDEAPPPKRSQAKLRIVK